MSVKPNLVFLCFFILFTCHSLCGLTFQDSPQSEPKNKEPLSKWSKLWLEEVVTYIITGDEKKYFLSLSTEAERGQFMLRFWKVRDTDSDTPENEFKLEHYRRIAMANHWFSNEGIAGWRTIRGKTLILLGPPHEVETSNNPIPFGTKNRSEDPLSQMMDVLGHHGGVEVWGYYGISKRVPYWIHFIFVDRFESGTYELAKAVSGGNPWKKGVELNMEAVGRLNMDNLHDFFDQLTDTAVALENPFEREDMLKGIITTQVSYEYIPLKSAIVHLKGSAKTHSTLSVEIPKSYLASRFVDGKHYFSLNVIVTIRDEEDQVFFEGSKNFNFDQTEEEHKNLKDDHYNLNVPMALKPNSYRVSLFVLDNFSGKVGTLEEEILLPSFGGEELMLSSVLLSPPEGKIDAASETVPEMNLLSMKRAFHSGEEMKVLFEVYNASVNPETGLCSLKVEYFFYQGGKLLAKVPSPIQVPEEQGAYLISTTFKLSQFKPGEYVLKIKVTDINSGNTGTKDAVFSVIE